MKGMLRSKRCQRCRRRKIKCDESWPTCTSCVRARVACSGPPHGSRLANSRQQHDQSEGHAVGNSSSPFITSSVARSSISSVRSSITALFDPALAYTAAGLDYPTHAIPLPSGNTAHSPSHMEMSYMSPEPGSGLRPEPTTTAERVAARLIGYLDKGSSYDASLAACYLHLLPARLGESAALRDTVALFCSCWGGFRRAVPADRLIDARAYGKALRSLQRALDDPRQQLSCETLAATTIMDRVEILFDARRRFGHVTHAKGISCLMSRRGPPRVDDELDIYLTLGNQGTLCYTWLLQGGTNFFLTTPWKDALNTALSDTNTSAPRLLSEAYRLDSKLGCWPTLLHQVYNTYTSPATDPERAPQASALRQQAETYAEMMAKHGDEFRREALETGQVVEADDKGGVLGGRYVFDGFESLQRWMMYSSVSLVLNRIITALTTVTDEPTTALNTEHRRLCRQVWLCLPYMLSLGAISYVVLATPVTLSFEGAEGEEREYVLDAVLEMDRYKGRLPRDREALADLLVLTARTITGRSSQDIGRFSLSI